MNILYTLNDKFVPQVAGGICSICENNKDVDDINFYLISNGISEENKKELLKSKELDEQEMAKISKENEEKQAIIDEFASSNKDSQTYIDNLNEEKIREYLN